MSEDNKQVSSPFSTGGGGTSFENKVQAAFVATMLSGGSAPTHPNSLITAIKLQRRYEKYKIDDFIVECQDIHNSQKCKLLAQVKHSLSITKGDKEFFEVVSAAWSDFNNPEIFSPENDCIALITGPLSKIDVEHVRPLLDWARHSAEADEFFTKVGKFSSKKGEKLAAFKYHLEQANGGKAPEDEKIWQFLKCFYLIGYDFDATSGGNLSLIHSMLKMSIVETASPNDVWAKLVTTIQDFNQDAGTITFDIDTLPKEIRDDFKSDISLARCSSIDKLKEHGDLILKGIRTYIANTHVRRTSYVDILSEFTNKSNFVIVTGSRGSGKSAIVKEFVEMHCEADSIFCLRTENLNKSHLDEVLTSIGIQMQLSELSARFAMMPKKYLIIESLEKLLELDNRAAFCDLLEFLKASKEWTVVASCREYALQQICSTYLQYQGVSHSILKVEEFSEDEFNVLLKDNPKIKALVANNKLSKLLRNPFMADMAVRVINSDTQSNITDEISFRKAVWQGVIRKESERTDGMPAKRAQAFMEISTQRAKQMVYEISENGFAEDAIYKLEEDGLLYRNSEKGLVRPSHDVLEDWAIEEFIEKAYQANSIDHNAFFNSIGNEPSIMRAFRFWLHQKLNIAQNPDVIRDWCINVLEDVNTATYWHDEIIIAILSGRYISNFLSCLRHKLLENQGKLLKRFCFLMRLACKISNTEALQNIPDSGIKQYMSFMLYKAWGDCWSEMIQFLFENRNEIDFESIPDVPLILDDYSSLININESFPKGSKETGLLATFLLEAVKDKYRHLEMQQRLLKIIIKVASEIKEEFNRLLKLDVFGKSRRDRPSYVRQLLQYILVDFNSATLCKYYPDLVTRLAWQEWILQNDDGSDPFRHSRIDVEECFGLSHKYDLRGFYPASGLKGPFWALLKWHESKGLDLIIKLCNHATEEYVKSRLDGKDGHQVDVILNDGTVHKQFCSGRLWGGYRGITVLPDILQSALMALENWLIVIAQQQDKKKLPEILDYILRQSNSVMTTAVVASVATGFPEIAGDAIWPLLRTAEFYDLDMQRLLQDSGSTNINWHRGLLSRDVYSVVYAGERDTANSHRWRKEGLEFLVCKLQFTQMKDKVYEIIDNYFKKFAKEGPDTENWRFRLLRTDLRNCKVVEDKENNCFRFIHATKMESDLQEKSEIAQKQQEEMHGFVNLFLWAEKEFEGETTGTQYYQDYREVLSSIKKNTEILNKPDRKEDLSCYVDGVIKATAVLIRDYANELEKSDLSWCIELLINTVTDNLNSKNQILVSTSGKAAIAVTQILPIILDYTEETEKAHIRELIVTALTHTNRDFRQNTAIGIQKHLWQIEPDFAQRCFDGAFEFARLQKVQWDSRKPIMEKDTTSELDQQLTGLRMQIINGIATVNSNEVSFDSHINSDLLIPFLMIPDKFISQQHTSLFMRMITLMQNAGVYDQKYNRHRESNLDLEEKFEFAKCLTRHIWALPANGRDKVVQTITNRIVDDLVLADDLLLFSLVESEQKKSLDIFWNIWEQIAVAIQENIEVILLNRRSNREGEQIINRLLFTDFPLQNSQHKEELREILTHGQKHLLTFVMNTCENVIVYEDFAKLVLYFPGLFFSEGLFILSEHAKNNMNVLDGINTIYYLEHLLRRILISNRSSNKIKSHIHDACLLLLNAMVEKGSTIAFFLREHLLTVRVC